MDRFSLRTISQRMSTAPQVLGFAAVLVLLLAVATVGISAIQAIHARLDLIVQVLDVKLSLVDEMYLSARERTYGLQKMMLVPDPFERDETSLRIDRFGARFAAARQRLLAMPLAPEERTILDLQGTLAGQAVPIQRHVATLIIEDRTEEARDLLLTTAIPIQEEILAQLGRLREIQQQLTGRASEEALGAQRSARFYIVIFGAGAVVLGSVIAVVTVRRVRRAEEALRREKERAEVTLHAIGDGVVAADASGRIDYLNPAAQRLTGWGAEAQGRPLLDVFRVLEERSHELLARTPDDLIDARGTEAVLQRRDGTRVAVEYTASSIARTDSGQGGVVAILRDVSEMRALSRQLDYQARHDPLTGLINRREFERQIQTALAGARELGHRHAVCFLDLDRFKVVNDTCGHAAGDELLRQVTQELKSKIRESDQLARLGGDEFGILLEGCPLEKAEQIAEQLRCAVNGFRFVWEGKGFGVGASIGVVPIEPDSGSLSDVLAASDAACYQAKEEGRDRVHISRRSSQEEQRSRAERGWQDRLREAMLEDRFELFVQPVTSLAGDGHPRGEVLLRLPDGDRQLLPTAFLPAAERYQLMPAIDHWVTRRLLQMMADDPDDERFYSVNLSGQSLLAGNFPELLKQELVRFGTPAERLCFELSETCAIANMSLARELTLRLRELGCRFMLDDFGTGLASFCYLRNLPIDAVKINGALVRNLTSDPMNQAMVESINQLGHVLGIRTVAKGVEDLQALELLRRMGVDFAQGFAIARPEPLGRLQSLGRAAG